MSEESSGASPASATASSNADETIYTGAHDALIVVDMQKDFCPGGALGVPSGDSIIPVINRLVPMFGRWVFTRDWHPPDHISFSPNPEYRDMSWPPHAVQNTPGAEWCDGLEMPMNAILVSKADTPQREAYSGFQNNQFDLAEFLKHRKVERVFITGLALDYCVRQTSLDAAAAGFKVFLIEDATKGIAHETSARALADLEAAGVTVIRSEQLVDSGERPPADYDDDGNPIAHHD